MADPIDTIKRAAAEAIAADKPVQLLFGTVVSASPLKIQLDQKATLLEPMLVLTRNVTDYEMDIDVSHWTEFEKSTSTEPRTVRPLCPPPTGTSMSAPKRSRFTMPCWKVMSWFWPVSRKASGTLFSTASAPSPS